jgi:DNA primase
MAIDFESFVQWCEERFPGDVQVKGKEVRLNSIFAPDHKHHLWCNPYGGKKHVGDGVYRCFYTEKHGTLVGLVMEVDNCSYEEAKELLSGNTPIRILEDELDKFFQEKEEQKESVEIKLSLPPYTYLISSLPKSSLLRMEAEDYLSNRKLPIDGLYVNSQDKDYKNRIIIPYYDAQGKLIYFNGRSMIDRKDVLRYRGPEKEIGVGKGDVIYATNWPAKGSKIYLTEGELDALTLRICGFNGMACGGKTLSDQQIQFIKDYKVCLALDEDEAGFSGILEMAKKLIANQIPSITYCRPPVGLKDWNKMLVKYKAELIVAWIQENEKPFDEFTNLNLLLNRY